MPICPGCREDIPYHRLSVHERHCSGIWGDRPEEWIGRSLERAESRFLRFETRLDNRLRAIEQRLSELEAKGSRSADTNTRTHNSG